MDTADRLVKARIALDWSLATLWLHYRIAGGTVSDGTLKRWMYGMRVPNADEYAILAHVINGRLRELDRTDALLPEMQPSFEMASWGVEAAA